jgi:acyl carrier protein
MKTPELLNAIENELGLPLGTIKLEDSFRQTKYWDSLAEIAFLAMIEEKTGVNITPVQMKEQNTIQDIVNLLKDKLED